MVSWELPGHRFGTFLSLENLRFDHILHNLDVTHRHFIKFLGPSCLSFHCYSLGGQFWEIFEDRKSVFTVFTQFAKNITPKE